MGLLQWLRSRLRSFDQEVQDRGRPAAEDFRAAPERPVTRTPRHELRLPPTPPRASQRHRPRPVEQTQIFPDTGQITSAAPLFIDTPPPEHHHRQHGHAVDHTDTVGGGYGATTHHDSGDRHHGGDSGGHHGGSNSHHGDYSGGGGGSYDGGGGGYSGDGGGGGSFGD